ncbi:MAG: hypothetical protein F6J93_14505 [Oscillatoria sp. SIO1A7]|nr:hypothetical protein [Oscillatoria sp. SIO1A7]
MGSLATPVTTPEEGMVLHAIVGLFVGFIVISAWVSDEAKVVTWIFDKSVGTLTVKKRGLLVTKVSEYPLQDIRKVRRETRIDVGLYGIEILLSETRRLHLCLDYSLFVDAAEKGVNCISQFLNL